MSTAINLGYQIELEQFEGPLALLLYLIRKEELDIYDIPITQITTQYLEYIKKMKELDLEVAGEFVAMAATLIHIKSRMLLPTYDENGEAIEAEDPRKELVQKLLEYQKYQEAAQKLYERPLKGRDFWLRGVREEIEPEKEGEILLEEENALFALIAEYRRVIRKSEKSVHKVGQKEQSIAQRILEIRDQLVPGERASFFDIVQGSENPDEKLLITFLSLLELGKMGYVSLFQSEPYADIYIEARKLIENNAISNVEEYDAAKAQEVADHLMAGDVGDLIEKTMHAEANHAASFHADQTDRVGLSEDDEEFAAAEEMATDEEILAEEARMNGENTPQEVEY